MSTLVFHVTDPSTDFLKPIYDGKGYKVINGALDQREAEAAIESHGRVFMLGHGGPFGLFTRGFAMTYRVGELLAAKSDGLYIWCNADAYAVRHKLSGLVSGMFISEVGEARIFGIEATQQEVDLSNNLFSKTVREVMESGGTHASVRERYTHATSSIVRFNSERLYVFSQGNPSPALHPSSASHQTNRPVLLHPQTAREFNAAWNGAEQPELDASLEDEVSMYLEQCVSGELSTEQAAEVIARHTDAYDYIEPIRDAIAGLKDGNPFEEVVQAVLNVVGF